MAQPLPSSGENGAMASGEVVVAERDRRTPSELLFPPSPSVRLLQYLLAVVAPAAATAGFFVLHQPLWSTLGLALLSLAGYANPRLKRALAFTRALFAFCALTMVINSLGIAYPYSNIFVLTGMLALFSFSGMEWRGLHFQAGQTQRWSAPAILFGLALSAVILGVFYLVPKWIGGNPTPSSWPVDVLAVVALGYATYSALMEETIFRGLLLAYGRQSMQMPLAIAAQAAVFGAMHYQAGFPNHAAGAVLAFIWAAIAGWLVSKSGSIFPAIVLHFVLVLTMFLVLAFVL